MAVLSNKIKNTSSQEKPLTSVVKFSKEKEKIYLKSNSVDIFPFYIKSNIINKLSNSLRDYMFIDTALKSMSWTGFVPIFSKEQTSDNHINVLTNSEDSFILGFGSNLENNVLTYNTHLYAIERKTIKQPIKLVAIPSNIELNDPNILVTKTDLKGFPTELVVFSGSHISPTTLENSPAHNNKSMWKVDLIQNTWSNISGSIPSEIKGRINASFTSFIDPFDDKHKAFLFGGQSEVMSQTDNNLLANALLFPRRDLWLYDIESNNWRKLPSCPYTSVCNSAGILYTQDDVELYVVTASGSFFVLSDDVDAAPTPQLHNNLLYKYSLKHNKWSLVSELPLTYTDKASVTAFTYNNTNYALVIGSVTQVGGTVVSGDGTTNAIVFNYKEYSLGTEDALPLLLINLDTGRYEVFIRINNQLSVSPRGATSYLGLSLDNTFYGNIKLDRPDLTSYYYINTIDKVYLGPCFFNRQTDDLYTYAYISGNAPERANFYRIRIDLRMLINYLENKVIQYVDLPEELQ